MIEIKLLGTYRIISDGTDITHLFSQKDKGLLCYITVNQENTFTRERLIGMFWDSYKRESAYSNLRYTIWHLRKIFKEYGNDIILHSRGKNLIEIEEKSVFIDLKEWQELTEKYNSGEDTSIENLIKISDLYYGDFLKDFCLADNLEFNDWVFNTKESLQRLYFETQMDLAKYYAKNNGIRKAIAQLNKLIQFDPMNETVYYTIMNYQYFSGNKVAAVNTYRNLKRMLRKELNISPSEKIQELYDHIINEEKKEIVMDTSYTHTKNISTLKYTATKREITFFISPHSSSLNNFHQKIGYLSKNSENYFIDICQSPGIRINYEGIFEIIDELQDYFKNQSNQIKMQFEDIVSEIMDSKLMDYHLFNNVTKILDTYVEKKVFIRIWNFHFLDSKSAEFISFLYRNIKNNEISFKIIIDEKWMNDKISYFVESFSGEQGYKIVKE